MYTYFDQVDLNDLPLNEDERLVFLRMVGPRYNTGRNEVRLTSQKFPNRIENKRYLTLLLEQLLSEAKRLNSIKSNFDE